MRIELRDERRRRVGRIEVDPAERPTRVSVLRQGRPEPGEAFLNWESSVDDAGQIRRCVACGCHDLFREKAFPQVTGFVVVMAFVGAVVGLFGLATNLPVLIIMVAVLVLDVVILLFSRRRLVCYRCRTSYHQLPIARYHRTWDRALADRHPMPAVEPTELRPLSAPATARP